MSESLPTVYLVRHGETAWSKTGQHTGREDLPLTEEGERQARLLGERLRGLDVAHIWSSPLLRARRTAELAGFGDRFVTHDDLMEWDYGKYQGLTIEQIRTDRPDWLVHRDGCPNGETPAEIERRADVVVRRIRSMDGDVLIFAHGHLLRVLTARWLGLPGEASRMFLFGTAGLSILGFEHRHRNEPVIRLWNDRSHLEANHQND